MIVEHPPARIQTTNLVIRCWSESDASKLREAVDASLAHLRPWMPWAMSEPSTLEATRARLRAYQASFIAGEDFVYGIFDSDESYVVGGSGLHPRVGPGALEIGYWIHADWTRRGYATQVTRALTTAGLEMPGIDSIEVRCDPNNTPSRRIPEGLGFRLLEVRKGDNTTSSGDPRDTMVFETRAANWS
jgi:RimJ/RimL family protein N-acetyltransferase